MLDKNRSVKFFLLCFPLFWSTLALAANTGDDFGLNDTILQLTNLVSGPGGKIVGISSLVIGVISTAIKFNPFVFLGSIGTCIACLAGPNVINAIFTATI